MLWYDIEAGGFHDSFPHIVKAKGTFNNYEKITLNKTQTMNGKTTEWNFAESLPDSDKPHCSISDNDVVWIRVVLAAPTRVFPLSVALTEWFITFEEIVDKVVLINIAE